jgi:hypothetical protein
MHIERTAPNYRDFDTHGNYLDGVIISPALVVGSRVRTTDGRWAECHPPNGRNLKNGAYGIRWWIDRDEWAGLDALWMDEDEDDGDDWAANLTAEDWAEIERQEAKSGQLLNQWIDGQQSLPHVIQARLAAD